MEFGENVQDYNEQIAALKMFEQQKADRELANRLQKQADEERAHQVAEEPLSREQLARILGEERDSNVSDLSDESDMDIDESLDDEDLESEGEEVDMDETQENGEGQHQDAVSEAWSTDSEGSTILDESDSDDDEDNFEYTPQNSDAEYLSDHGDAPKQDKTDDVPIPSAEDEALRTPEFGECPMCCDYIPIEPIACVKCYQMIGCRLCATKWFKLNMNDRNEGRCPLCRFYQRVTDLLPMRNVKEKA